MLGLTEHKACVQLLQKLQMQKHIQSAAELLDLRVSCYKHTHIPNSYLYIVCDSPP